MGGEKKRQKIENISTPPQKSHVFPNQYIKLIRSHLEVIFKSKQHPDGNK